MDKTLFTPAMIETFSVCKRAYKLAFGTSGEKGDSIKNNGLLKRFMLKVLVEIHRGKVLTVNQVQKYMGQHWPVDQLPADEGVKAFLFAYKSLTRYVSCLYHPDGAQVVGVGLKVRARIPHERIYVEDTFDLILWHPREKKLEFVDFHLHQLKPLNPAWPPASILVKQFLAERLQMRWNFEKLCITFCRIGPQGVMPVTINLDESIYRLHWTEMVKTLQEMKDPESFEPHRNPLCHKCQFLEQCMTMGQYGNELEPVSRTA